MANFFQDYFEGGKKKEKIEYTSFVLLKNGLAEMVYDASLSETKFAVFKDGLIEYQDCVVEKEKTIKPFPATKDILRNKVVYFPSKAVEYGSDRELLKEIQGFIHKYLQVSSLFEKIISHYVLFTWIYDNFNELPYIRLLGDWGSGKSRGIKTMGLLCYKPIFAGGSTTSSPIFRLLQMIPGTFVIDEADFSNSDIHNDITKILNCGYEKGLPVLRSEGQSGRFDPKSFNVFGPKILATREKFQDQALESRCLTEQMEKLTRNDILFNLPDSFWQEALEIRNKLLMWRFRNFGKRKLNPDLADRTIEPRLNQIIIPLLSIIEDQTLRDEIKTFIREYNLQLSGDRGQTLEAEIIEIIVKLIKETEPSMKEIADELNAKYEYDSGNRFKFSARKIGGIIRNKLRIKSRRNSKGAWIIPTEEFSKINRLKERYGMKKELENKTEPELPKEDDSYLQNLGEQGVGKMNV